MDSFSIQLPVGQSRNLTDVFNFLRNNSQQQSHLQVGFADGDGETDKIRLIVLDEEKGNASIMSGSGATPSWVNVLDEINYEMTRIKTRQISLKELQQKHLVGLNFNDENTSPEQERIKELTDELTTMFTHTRRLIRLLEESEVSNCHGHTFNLLHENVVSSLMLSLNNLLLTFQAFQSSYLKQLDARAHNVDTFLLTSHFPGPSSSVESGANNWMDSNIIFGNFAEPNYSAGVATDYSVPSEELSIAQIQQIMQNEHMTKEREKEVIKISQSILELNTLFKDISALILDQGTILDRIDYNVERSSIRIKSAFKDVQKAQSYQKGSRKMQLILILAGVALFLMLLILLTKF